MARGSARCIKIRHLYDQLIGDHPVVLEWRDHYDIDIWAQGRIGSQLRGGVFGEGRVTQNRGSLHREREAVHPAIRYDAQLLDLFDLAQLVDPLGECDVLDAVVYDDVLVQKFLCDGLMASLELVFFSSSAERKAQS